MEVKVVIDNLANFLSISPNQTKFFPSVCLVPAGHFFYFGFSLYGVNLKVYKREKFFGSDFEFFTIL